MICISHSYLVCLMPLVTILSVSFSLSHSAEFAFKCFTHGPFHLITVGELVPSYILLPPHPNHVNLFNISNTALLKGESGKAISWPQIVFYSFLLFLGKTLYSKSPLSMVSLCSFSYLSPSMLHGKFQEQTIYKF